jgi:Trk-type K+ transport system membrane component
VYPIFFELLSAFGTVGLSFGYPGSVLALSAQFNTFGKLVVCAVMLLGKHRDLPKNVDPAVHLPSLLNNVAADGTIIVNPMSNPDDDFGGAGRASIA